MAIDRPAVFSEDFLGEFIYRVAEVSTRPEEDVATFLLSFRAGLRAQEIAGLEWVRHILDVSGNFRSGKVETISPTGRVAVADIPYIQITSDIGKHNNERSVEMHIDVEPALQALLGGNGSNGFVIPNRYHVADDFPPKDLLKKRADAIRKRMKRMYEKVLEGKAKGHSSHFGRRNFITTQMRSAHRFGMTLFDVQEAVGHRSSDTTKLYVESSPGRARSVRGITP